MLERDRHEARTEYKRGFNLGKFKKSSSRKWELCSTQEAKVSTVLSKLNPESLELEQTWRLTSVSSQWPMSSSSVTTCIPPAATHHLMPALPMAWAWGTARPSPSHLRTIQQPGWLQATGEEALCLGQLQHGHLWHQAVQDVKSLPYLEGQQQVTLRAPEGRASQPKPMLLLSAF